MNTIAAKYRLTAHKCYYCEAPIVYVKQNKGQKQPDNLRTIDHRIPVSRGGKNELQNYVECCNKCNSEKGQLTETEYLIVLKYRKASKFTQVAVGMLLGLAVKILMFKNNSA